jgi:hypothetical protein
MESDAITANGMMSFRKSRSSNVQTVSIRHDQETMSQTLEASVSALKA